MREIKQFFHQTFNNRANQLRFMAILILGIGINIFAATGLIIAIYFRQVTFTIKQIQITSNLKRLGMTRSEYNHINGQILKLN